MEDQQQIHSNKPYMSIMLQLATFVKMATQEAGQFTAKKTVPGRLAFLTLDAYAKPLVSALTRFA